MHASICVHVHTWMRIYSHILFFSGEADDFTFPPAEQSDPQKAAEAFERNAQKD